MLLIYAPSPNRYCPAPTLPVAVIVTAEITLAPVILPCGPVVVKLAAITFPLVLTSPVALTLAALLIE